MKILITGNMGYLGPAVARQLRMSRPGAVITGLDSGLFAGCLAVPQSLPQLLPECQMDYQCFADIRNFPRQILDGVDAVVHLAAAPGGPQSNLFEDVTFEINYLATIELANEARRRGVSSFVYASSCSIYGLAASGKKMMEYATPNPLTAYAKSKVFSERQLERFAGPGFKITSLRFPEACGMSERLRLDLVMNGFVAEALSTGQIVLPGGDAAWRPLINVKDMARAIDWAISRDSSQGGHFLAVNAGSVDGNYRIKDIALAVADEIPGIKVFASNESPADISSYAVDFSLFEKLAPEHQPLNGLRSSILEVKSGLEGSGLLGQNQDYRSSRFMRFKMLDEFISKKILSQKLLWVSNGYKGMEELAVTDAGYCCAGSK